MFLTISIPVSVAATSSILPSLVSSDISAGAIPSTEFSVGTHCSALLEDRRGNARWATSEADVGGG